MADITIVEINGTEYYCPNDYVDDLVVVDNRLVNTGSQTITLYHEFREYGTSNSGYPRITCPSNTYAYISQSYSSSYQTLTINAYTIKNRSFSDLFLIGCVIVGILSIMLFRRK